MGVPARRALRPAWAVALLAGSLLSVAAAAADDPGDLKAQYRRPNEIPFPADNPYSDAKAALGHVLFFDPRLSGSNTASCASCHNPALGWEDGLPVATGDGAKSLERASPTILNLAWAEPLMWDGRKDTLEEQATGPIEAAGEMNQPIASLVAELSDIPAYRRLFREAFGSETISGAAIARALATFERTIVSNKAPFDRWIEGDEGAIPEEAKQGFALFNGKANCAACHSGWRFTDDSFHDIGLNSADPGRGALLPDIPVMRHAFKTPTLRNVATREPFMHDGSAATLRDVIVHYDTGFVERPSLSPEMRRLGLTPGETEALLAFLRTLTSEDDPIPAPTLPTKEASS
ncbi:c-type cytochrome (plasmid) [Skermanella sp. TT6]|uniref:C-type cytochrome n=1 Tax=Skermanella cutis TaxID=2775420 RepID=A0ABX7BIU4_9PROT|nr:cytochrome c peroxidase [Skermanella sp. TT6]QQP93984.1 c-type cytochrome [Skermanella sp. TT6]